MYIKNREDLRASLIASYNALLDIDVETTGSSERDIFVEAPIEGQLNDIWVSLDYLQKLQSPILYENDLLDEDKDDFCRNHGVGNIPATYARGTLLLFTTSKPTEDIYMNSTYTVATADSSVSFRIAGYYTLRAASAEDYYNALTNRYEMTVQIVAQSPGTSGNLGANKITKITSAIKGITGCTNNAPTYGGQSEGTLSQRMAMVKQKLKGRTLGNIQGIKTFVENYASGVTVVGTNDPLMLRNEGMGSGIDIYVKGFTTEGAQDTVAITSTGLVSLSSAYDATSIRLANQPVQSIAVCIKTSTGIATTLSNEDFTLTRDTNLLMNSTRGNDRLVLTSTGLVKLGPFKSGDLVEIQYNYNSLLHSIESQLNAPINLYDNRDYLLYQKATVGITTFAKIKLYTGFDIKTVENAYSIALASFLETFSGNYVEFSDIVGLIKNTAGVDNLDLSTSIISTSTGNILSKSTYISTDEAVPRTQTASGDIPIYDREYPIAGAVTFTSWA